MLRLQGFPDSFKIAVSEHQTRKQAGNAVPVNIIRAVLESFLPVMLEDGRENGSSVRRLSPRPRIESASKERSLLKAPPRSLDKDDALQAAQLDGKWTTAARE